MIELIILIVALLLMMLAIIWGYFIRVNQIDTGSLQDKVRESTNVELYKEHKIEIEKDYADGAIDEENYQYLLAELDKSLVQDLEQNKAETIKREASNKRLSIMWPSLLTIFVLVFSFGVYLKTGAYEKLAQPQVSEAQPDTQSIQQQALSAVEKYTQQVQQQPNSSDAWYGLGQAYVGIGDFDSAVNAFNKVIEIDGEHADIFGAKAQALYYKANQKITPEVQALIDKALQLDPNDPSTNIMLGMHNFMAQRYDQAITYWQRVLDSNSSNVNVQALESALAEAKNRLSLTGNSQQSAVTPAASNNDIVTNSNSGPSIKLFVSISDEIQEKLNQGTDKVVFIYAIPTNGMRMPVAVVKMMASDLPTTIILDNTRAMSPQANLSSVDEVNVFAVISKKGSVGIKSGDFKTERNGIDVNTKETITLAIDSIVP